MLIHAGRVGSTVLSIALTSQDLIAAGEIYNAGVYPVGEWWLACDYAKHFQRIFDQRLELPQPYLGPKPERDRSWYLFEYKPFHSGCSAPLQEAVARFHDSGVSHFVSLTRKNQLRRYVSYLISSQSGVWHTYKCADAPTRVRIDVERVSDYEIGFAQGTLLQSLDYYYESLMPHWEHALAGVPSLKLTYEDHVEKDPSVAYRAVVDFLGMDGTRAHAPLSQVRQNAWPLSELIENFDEVERALRGTPYAALLHD